MPDASLALRVQISWREAVITEPILSPPRAFFLGEHDADFAMPRAVLGCDRLELVRISGDAILVNDGHAGFVPLFEGQRASLELGDFRITLCAEAPARVRFGRGSDRRIAPFFAGALALGAGFALWGQSVPPPVEDELDAERLALMQYYLRAQAEREVEDEQDASSSTWSVQGPSSGADPSLARAVALREASEFGMIGLLSTSAGGAPGTAGSWASSEPAPSGDPFGDQLDPQSGEDYADHGINPPVDPEVDPLSTFAIDVDTGSYTIAKRKLESGVLPPLASVRTEELVNAFDYGYAGPEQLGFSSPFSVHLDAAPSPFDQGHHLVRVAVQGRRIPHAERPPVHLVYLVDTSGSMQSPDKLALAQTSLRLLTGSLKAGDTVALCTYAGDTRVVLPPTGIDQRPRILAAIDDLAAGGSTAMASGIENAYRLAARTHTRGQISRVVILSDGDANVGPTTPDELLKIIRQHSARGITLSTIGFGQGNYKDSLMEQLADAGDGNYAYIGSTRDARRTFEQHAGSLLQVIAKDVKIQVEFDPTSVASYRLLGYENRDVSDDDFRNDHVDGGEIGAGHSVTALYDVVLRNTRTRNPVTVRLRHQPPQGSSSSEIVAAMPWSSIQSSFESADSDFRFASAVAAFAEVLRGSPYALDYDLSAIGSIAAGATESQESRSELVSLIERASHLRQGLALLDP